MKIRTSAPRALAATLLLPGLLLSGLLAAGLAGCGRKSDAPGQAPSPAAPASPSASGGTGAAPAIDASTVARSWTGSQPAVDATPARTVTLDLKGDGTASLTIVVGPKTTVRTGKWRTDGPTVQFDPVEKDGSAGSRIVWSLIEGRLHPNAWSGDDWGTGGPPALDRK